MEELLHLLLLLAFARIFGHLAIRAHQPASVGEIAAGIALAFLVVLAGDRAPFLATLTDSAAVETVAEAGVFLLLLYAGMEMEPAEIADHSRQALAIAAGGMVLPLAAGFALAWFMLPESGLKTAQSMVVGTALAISAIPVAAKILMEYGILHQPVGESILSAALFNDIMGLVLLAVIASLAASGHFPGPADFALLGGKVALFFAVTVALGHFGYRHLWRWIAGIHVPGLSLAALLGIALAYALLAGALGMHFAMGPFVAGLFFEKARVAPEIFERVSTTMHTFTYGLAAPLFFASIGIKIVPSALPQAPFFLALLLAVAVAGKVVGGGLPAWFCGFSPRQSLVIGIGLTGRGAVEIVIANIALEAGIFASNGPPDVVVDNLFSFLVITAVVTTLLTPVLLRLVLRPASCGDP